MQRANIINFERRSDILRVKRLLWRPLITMIVLSTVVRVKALSAVDDQGIIAIHYNGASTVSWVVDQEPATYPFLYEWITLVAT